MATPKRGYPKRICKDIKCDHVVGHCDCEPEEKRNSEAGLYCHKRCSGRSRERRHRARQREEKVKQRKRKIDELLREDTDEARREVLGLVNQGKTGDLRNLPPKPVRVRRGPMYRDFVANGWPEILNAQQMSQKEVAEYLETSEANVSGWMAAWVEDEQNRVAAEEWEFSPEATRALNDFAYFRSRYFKTETGDPYVTTDFHRRWITATLRAMEVGGRLEILSPPRHGKTELLTHFCVWLIIKFPNIRIMWVGLNDDIATQSVELVRDILANNEDLEADFLRPGQHFPPEPGSGRKWAASKFTTGTREISLKSPTMVAVGRGGKLLSRDADLIVLDDIIDHATVKSPTEREDDIKWVNTQLGSRKESHTAVMAIGSRQHHHDLWGRIEKNPVWSVIVERAHDENCPLPRHEEGLPEGHDEFGETTCEICTAHQTCMLWPGKRTFSWLEEQRFAYDDDEHFEMVYNNKTRPAGALYLVEDDIRRCYNAERRIGEYPPAARLAAGLDPASSGDQVGFLWGYHPREDRRYMVDIDIERGGGLPGARRVIELFYELYGCRLWVIERNGYQSAILQDKDILQYASSNGISLRPSFTDKYNKFDPSFGVTKQFSYFKQDAVVLDRRTGDPVVLDGGSLLRPKIDLPYADANARHKTHLYRDQLLDFEGATKHTKTDIVMGGWLPETVFRVWRREQLNEVEDTEHRTDYPFEPLGEAYHQPEFASAGATHGGPGPV